MATSRLPADARVSPAAPTHTTPPSDGASDAQSDWTALDEIAFDSSLSFLQEADDKPLPSRAGALPETEPCPPRLPDTDPEDTATAELLKEMLALRDDPRENEPVVATPSSTSTLSVQDHGSDSSTVSPPPAAPTAKPKRDYVAFRVRQKQEIAYLRTQVVALERELAMLKQPGAPDAGHQSSVWKSIAQRQLGEKLRAEIENSKLRELLEGQLRVAQSLEKLLRKRVLTESDAFFVERKRARGQASMLDLEAAVNEIRGRVSDQFAEVDAVLIESGIANVTSDLEDARTMSDPENAICMELATVKVVPFAWKEVAEAAWDCTCINGGTPASRGDDGEARTEFTLEIGLHVRRSEAVIRVRGVCARRDAEKRAVFVFENAGIVDGPLVMGHAINCRERGYIVIQEASNSSPSAPSTVVRACARMWPEAETDEAAPGNAQRPIEVGLFVDVVLGLYNQHFDTLLQAVENVLLSRTVAKKQ